jgi:predicted RNase H-like nuclease (RuvC/YqgF family)
MKAKIAVATVSGKAYYFIVNELKRKKLPFLSLKPTDKIPVDIRVVITTEKEEQQVTYPNKVVYKEDSDPIQIVAEAELITRGKTIYEKIVIGIDPGKTFGLAVLGDGKIIETANSSSEEETVRSVMDIIKREPASSLIIRIGDSAPTYANNLLRLLEQEQPV